MEHGSGSHAIFNQTPPLMEYNLFSSDAALQEAVQRGSGGWGAVFGASDAPLDHAAILARAWNQD